MTRLKCISFSVGTLERVKERRNHYDHLSLVWIDSAGYFGRPPTAHLDTPILEANIVAQNKGICVSQDIKDVIVSTKSFNSNGAGLIDDSFQYIHILGY